MSHEPESWRPTVRQAHAHMLKVAAARRLRALERAGLQRLEDAAYWKQLAPFALSKARSLRGGFPPLP